MRQNENPVPELLGIILGNPECKLEGWVAIARPVNIHVRDTAAELMLARPGVKAVSVFNLGVNLESVDLLTYGSLASGAAFGRIDTLIGLNVLSSVDAKRRHKVITLLSQLLTPNGLAYFTRPLSGSSATKKARVQYFTDMEFKQELSGFFTGPAAMETGNSKYSIIKCGGAVI